MSRKITKEKCNALIHFPDENLITKRKLNKIELKMLYKKLLKECNNLYMTKSSLQKTVMDSVKLRLGNVNTIETRVHNLKIMKKYLSLISPCIVTSEITSHMLALVKKDKGRFQDVIYFNKQIGSESAYGVAYLNTGVDEGSRLVFSTKVTSENNKNEIELLEKMSYAVQHYTTPNFPIIYKVLHCKDVKENKNQSTIDIKGINDIIKNNRYYVILNELANGDLGHFLEKKNNTAIEFESVLFQVFISLRTFHIHTNHIHNDAHIGNFLYHEIEKGGYWHYKYKNTNIYVPNVGYLLVVWDPGLAHKIEPRTEYMPITDYYRIYGIIESYYQQGKINLPDEVFIQLKLLIKYITLNNRTKDIDAIMKYLEKKPKFKYILFSPPLNSHIINEKPYYL